MVYSRVKYWCISRPSRRGWYYPRYSGEICLERPRRYAWWSSPSLVLNRTPVSLRRPIKYHMALPQHVKTPTQLHDGSLNPMSSNICTVAWGYWTTFIVKGVVDYSVSFCHTFRIMSGYLLSQVRIQLQKSPKKPRQLPASWAKRMQHPRSSSFC